ncbi:T6SS amidase immunity protein Tai4 family protein [Moritella yayanosii]|uniref:Lipoprotein n=1 Tax=Moritella yayanosii TaxID=69539 RepID=A0A330LLB6_9GAMM|nr:T6SS amidase immunity protein Tai4 family protein [Moritella yayanosii]SQD77192.1 conserved exported protein of unknown function [Moritella yayanosii]
MNKIMILILVSVIASCSSAAMKEADSLNQKTLYKNWVLSRCLAAIVDDKKQKKDAFNTASAYLEVSNLPVEYFLASETLMQQFISLEYQGSISGSFNTKKCIDLFGSKELDNLYHELTK